MNRTRLKALRIDIDEALAKVGTRHNMEIWMGNASFTDTGFNSSMRGDEISPQGVNKQKEADWQLAVKLDLVKLDWLGKVISGGYIITGYDHKKRSRNIILTKDGKTYSGKAESIERSITRTNLVQGEKP